MQIEKQKPWHGIGVDVDANLSSREMLYKAKLDWEVSKIPSQRPKSYGNQETLRFFKGFFEAGEAEIETVGGLDAARILWGLARLNENFTLKGGDEVKGYLLLASRDEGREKIEIHFLIVRESCHNMLKISSNAKPRIKNIFRRTFKPTFPFLNQKAQKFDDEMITKVKGIVAQGREAISAFADDARLLADKKVDETMAWRFMFDVFQPETIEDISTMGKKELEELAENKTKLAIEAFSQAPGQELQSASMTAWGLLNAVTYIIDHHLGSNQDSRLRQAWFGPNAKIKKRAFSLALEL
jgi:phage/plasmid-like protein (TIGR03299 family)